MYVLNIVSIRALVPAVFILAFLSLPVSATQKTVSHDIQLVLDRSQRTLTIHDQVTFPVAPSGKIGFTLSPDAKITFSNISISSESSADDRFRRYSLHWPSDKNTWRLSILLPWPGEDVEYLWLDSSRPWFPQWSGSTAQEYPLLRHRLEVALPAGWHAVSQGEQERGAAEVAKHVKWLFISNDPQQTIEFVAAPFHVYTSEGPVTANAFLLQQDTELANKYLSATSRYITLYEKMLGAYAYKSFSLVENPEQTGYGMPSFTLLGSRVIRLPFIVHSSYPHEILHNWWGNSVYVHPDSGNWSEGLTAYLADHYLKELKGEGRQYRRDALQAYRNYVSVEKDFPLSEFHGRHDRASQAVGYNKTLMLFHMLRNQLGEEKFFGALQEFYREKKFQLAGFDDLREFFERAGAVSLRTFFAQWTRRVGAPILRLGGASRDGKTIGVMLKQTQPGPGYELLVPAVFVDADGAIVRREVLRMDHRQQTFALSAPPSAHSIQIDPNFDVFRLLDETEIPPSIGALLGKNNWTFVLPRSADPEQVRAYRSFAMQWGASLKVAWDDQELPVDQPVWLLGWENRKLPRLTAELSTHSFEITQQGARLAGNILDRETHTVIIAGQVGSAPWIWLSQSASGLARRLRHYGKYSYVAFKQGRPVLRGQWPVTGSVLQRKLD